jgi:uncharacterized protein
LTVAAEVLDLLQVLDAPLGRPRVQALHLPPPPADGSQRGEFAALQLEDGSVGLCYVLLDGLLERLRADERRHGGSRWAGRAALDVAAALARPPGLEHTVAWAAAQAMGDRLARLAGWSPPPADDSFAGLAPGPGDHVGLVGLFGPLMDRLVATGARITVLELRSDLAGERAGYEVTLDPTRLAACNKVLATGTLLLNGTLDAVLQHLGGATRVAMIGPTVGALPDPLFARGVHVVGGTWLEDPAAFVEALREGRARGASARKFTLERTSWPGWRAVRERLG